MVRLYTRGTPGGGGGHPDGMDCVRITQLYKIKRLMVWLYALQVHRGKAVLNFPSRRGGQAAPPRGTLRSPSLVYLLCQGAVTQIRNMVVRWGIPEPARAHQTSAPSHC
jgi:hypothetical protein